MLLLYMLLLIGSLSLGAEALVLGMGGKIIPLYRKRPLFVLGTSACLGFLTVLLSFAAGTLLKLEALYVCVLAFALTLVFGRIIAALKPQIEREFKLTPEKISDQEIEQILKKRGLKI